jgi:nucleoside-triphosphatase THEP1
VPHPVTLLVTGEVGAGKTTACARFVELARAQGISVGGILTEPEEDPSGRRVGLWARDLWRGERFLLASCVRPLSDLRRGPYSFDPAAFAWGIAAVQMALSEGAGLVILDEVGPVELERGEGFAPLIAPLAEAAIPVVWVVRRSCRATLEARLGGTALAFEVDAKTREGLPGLMMDALRGVPREAKAILLGNVEGSPPALKRPGYT